MRLFWCLGLCLFVHYTIAQTYTIADVQGDVQLTKRTLSARDELRKGSKLYFSDSLSFVELITPKGLLMIRPQASDRKGDVYVVKLRRKVLTQPITPYITVRGSTARRGDDGLYFANGAEPTLLAPYPYQLGPDRLEKSEEVGLLFETNSGLLYREKIIKEDGIWLEPIDFEWSELRGKQIKHIAVVCVRDKQAWRDILRKHSKIFTLQYVVDRYFRSVYVPIKPARMIEQVDPETGEIKKVVVVDPDLPVEIVDVLNGMRFVDTKAFINDMMFLYEQLGGPDLGEFINPMRVGAFIQRKYGSPKGYMEILERLAPSGQGQP